MTGLHVRGLCQGSGRWVQVAQVLALIGKHLRVPVTIRTHKRDADVTVQRCSKALGCFWGWCTKLRQEKKSRGLRGLGSILHTQFERPGRDGLLVTEHRTTLLMASSAPAQISVLEFRAGPPSRRPHEKTRGWEQKDGFGKGLSLWDGGGGKKDHH